MLDYFQMNFKKDFKITEYDKLNLNKKQLIQSKSHKINLFLILLIIIILFITIIIFFLFYKLEKKINHIIKFKSIEKDMNKEIFKKLDFVKKKLEILNQEVISNKKIGNYNNNNFYYLLSIKEVLGYKKIRIGKKKDGGYILLNDLKNIKIGYTVEDIINFSV